MKADTFAVGDRVTVLGKFVGEVIDVDADEEPRYLVDSEGDRSIAWYHEADLEHIDEEATTDDETVSTSLAGPSLVDSGSAGTSTEPATEEPPLATIARLEGAIEALKWRVKQLEHLMELQNLVNATIGESLEGLHTANGELVTLHAEATTTRRMRVNVTKNSRGYNHDVTFEITSSDPDLILPAEMLVGLRDADTAARNAITEAQHTDAEGLPGSDESF